MTSDLKQLEVHANSIAIIGWEDGGAGQIHSWMAEIGYHVACFVNPADALPEIDIEKERRQREARQFDFPTPGSFKGIPLVSAEDWFPEIKSLGINKALVVIPNQVERLANIEEARESGFKLIQAIHPTATILDDAVLADNVVLYARAFVGYRAELRSGVMVNSGAQIDHHNVIYECANIDPGVTTAGNVTVGRFANVHTGATLINKVRVGEHAIVGAGAVIINDVPPHATVVGVPGRVIKSGE